MTLMTDLRYALRSLGRRRGSASAVVLALALGPGAAAAMFAVADAVLLQPLPYADPDRLVVLRQLSLADDENGGLVAPATYLDWRDDVRTLAATAAVRPWTYTLVDGAVREDFDAGLVSEGFFDVIGVQPVLGRPFRVDDYAQGAATSVVLTHEGWLRAFGGDPAVVGRTVSFDDETLTIIGVLPESFWWFDRHQVMFAPLRLTEQHRQLRVQTYLTVVGRLAAGHERPSAQVETDVVAARLAEAFPAEYAGTSLVVRSVLDDVAGDIRPALLLLLGAVGLLCAIAVANVAGLMIVRGVERGRELDVRAALGAGTMRLARQLLIESTLLALVATVLGLVFARWLIQLLVGLAPADVPRLESASINVRVTVVGATIAVLMASAATIVPMWRLFRVDGLRALRSGAPVGDVRSAFVRRALVAGEVALTFVLLVGALLLGQSFARLVAVDPGFDATRVAMIELHAWSLGAPEVQAAYFSTAMGEASAIVGVESVGAVSAPPFLGAASIEMEAPVSAAGAIDQARPAWLTVASVGYVETLSLHLQEGRTFTRSDRAGGAPVAILSDSLARRLFGGAEAVGRLIHVDDDRTPQPLEVVGVVSSLRHVGLDAGARDEMFVPLAQVPFGSMNIVVRTSTEVTPVLPAVLAAIGGVSPVVQPSGVTVLEDLVGRTVAPRRFYFTLAGWLAALALALAAVGLYGLVSAQMAQRTREIGLRVALGGRQRHVLALVFSTAFWPPMAGVALGAVAAWSASGMLRATLFGVQPTDPATYAVVAVVLLIVAAGAAIAPARRALRVDPVVALRTE